MNRIQKLVLVAGLTALLLAGCSGAISAKRATLATAQPHAQAVEPTATAEPLAVETTPPQPTAQDTGADLGPFVNWFALASVLLLFVAMTGGAFFVYCYFISRWAFKRNAHLFTRRNTQ